MIAAVEQPGMVDWHTHAVAADLAPPRSPGAYPWPRVRRDDDDPSRAHVLVGDRPYRRIDDRCWSAERRIADMDAEGVAVQVLSPMPVTLCHDAPGGGAAAYARAQNDFLAGVVAQAPHRFRGLAAVPLQDPTAAATELRHAVVELGLAGAEIGTRVGGLELADPAFDPFFDAADELGATILVHPVDETLDPRLAAAGLAFGVGMPCETATAGAGLLVADALARRPNVRVCLAHGGGALPALLGRVTRGQELAAGLAPGEHLAPERTARMRARRLWADSLTYDGPSLRRTLECFGADHVVLGTDYPFAAREAPAGAVLDEVDAATRTQVGRVNATVLMSPTPEPHPETR